MIHLDNTTLFHICRLFKLVYEDFSINLIARDSPPLQSVGPQRCLAFSTDGTKFAIGGEVSDHSIFFFLHMFIVLTIYDFPFTFLK
jgi:prolactin regulatory element-binding protein